jgi:acetyl-CoA acetyltransferase
MAISEGFADVVLCAGMEHMTHIPLGGANPTVKISPKLSDPKYKRYDIDFSRNMGFTAQKLQAATRDKQAAHISGRMPLPHEPHP